MSSFDARLYLDLNAFAIKTAWAHDLVKAYALYAGYIALGLLVLLACWRARDHGWSRRGHDRLPVALWTPLAGGIAFALALGASEAIGRTPPYRALHGSIEVLAPKVLGSGFPSAEAAIAGAVAGGLWLVRERILAIIGAVASVLMSLALVYVGLSYPGDVLAGLVVGAVVVVALRPLGTRLIADLVQLVRRPAWPRPGIERRQAATAGDAPEVRPRDAVASDTVRILETGARPVPHVPDPDGIQVARKPAAARTHVETTRRASSSPVLVPDTGHDDSE